MRWKSFGSWIVAVGLICAASLNRADAQSTNAPLTLTYNQTMFDPATVSTLDPAAKAAFTADLAQMNSGADLALVLTSSPDGKGWSVNQVLKATPIFSIADIARASLETCEYVAGSPCMILSINGHDTQRPGGGWDIQPHMLFKRPTTFDAGRVPFIVATDRIAIAPYAKVTGNRALVVTYSGGWLWRTGDTIDKAVSTAMSDCATTLKGQACMIYAINDRVVFEPN